MSRGISEISALGSIEEDVITLVLRGLGLGDFFPQFFDFAVGVAVFVPQVFDHVQEDFSNEADRKDVGNVYACLGP